MSKMTIDYQAPLSTHITHTQSNAKVQTDAPVDNGGNGESFSPTDLLSSALGSCMLTIMALKAQSLNLDLADVHIDVEKIMTDKPRRVAEIIVNIHFSQSYDDKTRTSLEKAAKSCPVAHSLHPELKQTLQFHYPA